MKKFLLIIIVLILLAVGWYGYKKVMKQQTVVVPSEQETNIPETQTNNCLTITNPKSGQTVASPLTVTVIVDNTKSGCRWTVFEAQAGTVELTDSKGTVVGKGVLKTTDDWTKNGPVTYTATITFTKTANNPLTLTVTEENPGGKPNPQTVTLPLSQ